MRPSINNYKAQAKSDIPLVETPVFADAKTNIFTKVKIAARDVCNNKISAPVLTKTKKRQSLSSSRTYLHLNIVKAQPKSDNSLTKTPVFANAKTAISTKTRIAARNSLHQIKIATQDIYITKIPATSTPRSRPVA